MIPILYGKNKDLIFINISKIKFLFVLVLPIAIAIYMKLSVFYLFKINISKIIKKSSVN